MRGNQRGLNSNFDYILGPIPAPNHTIMNGKRGIVSIGATRVATYGTCFVEPALFAYRAQWSIDLSPREAVPRLRRAYA